MNFTIYPDVWLRDLTCIKFEDGSYIANKASVGTNMCLLDGTILVDRVKVGKNSMIGHSTLLGPGVNFQENIETAVFNILGIRTRVESGTKLGAGVGVSHGTIIGANCDVGHYVYLGTRCVIGPNIRIPAGASLPSGTSITSQEDCDNYYSSETRSLNNFRQEIFTALGTVNQEAISGLRTENQQNEPWTSSGSSGT
jgi:UDP-3-O-[3-hydroxymyristoyl] glucosamine N-acyltransferase